MKSRKILIILVILLFLIATLLFVEIGDYKRHINTVKSICKQENMEVSLVLAIIKTESNFNEKAVSKKGAKGLMQLMPKTADYIAKISGYDKPFNIFNSSDNVLLGVRYYKYLYLKFNDEVLALSAYNAGEGVVSNWLESGVTVPKYGETINYLKKVKRRKILYKILIGG